jgi:hypothetical protein
MNEKMFRYINISIIGVGFYFLFIFLFSRTIVDFDIWGYLAFGRIFWEGGYFPYKDIFAYTPTNTMWIYHEWLTGLIFYPILKYAGPAGLQLFRYVIIVITIYLIYLTAKKKGAKPVSNFVCLTLALILMSWGYTPVMRAQIFTYLSFILTIFIIETARKDEKWIILLWLLPVMAIWCNLHGGFIAGLGLIGLYALGDGLSGKKFIPFIVILFAAALVTLINPYGIEYWKYMLHAVSMQRPDIYEWLSVISSIKINYLVALSVIFVVLSTMALLAVVAFRGKQYLTEMILLAVMIFLGYKHIRHTVLFGIMFGAFMPIIFSQLWDALSKKFNYFNQLNKITPALLMVFFLSTTGVAFINKPQPVKLLPFFSISAPNLLFPVGALKWLEENKFEGNILAQFEWGQYLIWSCYPQCRVAIDGRYETVYPDEVSKEYFDFIAKREGWRIFLNKYHHDAILLKSQIATSAALFKEEPLWKLVYSDPCCALFIRKDYKKRKKAGI